MQARARFSFPFLAIASAAQAPPVADHAELQRDVVRCHAAWCHELYAESVRRAHALATAVDALLATPGERALAAARAAWCDARTVYCRTEVLRFQGGPIEPLEPLLNAWPIDEAFVDYVAGAPDAGIVADPRGYPSLGGAVLRLANERGGEANVTVGWHAIEFLLWGQDLAADGPGRRPFTDYVAGQGRHAERRGEYLRTVCAALLQDLTTVRDAWAPDRDNHRRAFERDERAAVRAMLTGACVLTAFELTGERLTVALETRDQEQEHSCFSDTTTADLVANQAGIEALLRGRADGDGKGPGLLALVAAHDRALARFAADAVTATTRAIAAIPAPFDQAFLGDDDAPGRRAIRAAIEALEQQTEALQLVGKRFGHDLPLQPGG
jgi:putative iron-regulated protein